MNTTHNTPSHYRIQIKEQIDPHWADWFPGFEIQTTIEHDGNLEGENIPPDKLRADLGRLRDLGLPILLIEKLINFLCRKIYRLRLGNRGLFNA